MPTLVRRLGLSDAVVLGVGSMVGAGVFAAFTPAAQSAGNGLLIGLAIAAFVAFCNATSTAQLAASMPVAGGSYAYGRTMLGPWWGFIAGWGFVIGKTASCAAMAMTFAAYVVPEPAQRPAAALVVIALTVVNLFGITRTALATRILVAIVLGMLAVTTVTILSASADTTLAFAATLPATVLDSGPYGILQSAGLLFFAFAGYARIATLAEEVRDPARTIPRAIVIAVTVSMMVYLAVAVTVLVALGPDTLARTDAPLQAAAQASEAGWLGPLVTLGAAAASLGALLALLAGIGRTSLAMAREGDLPRGLAALHPRSGVPYRADLAVAAAIVILVLVTDVRGAIGFSSLGVLVYYVVANLSALRQPAEQRRYPRVLAAFGILGCCALLATLPLESLLGGVSVLVIGVAYRVLSLRRWTPNSP